MIKAGLVEPKVSGRQPSEPLRRVGVLNGPSAREKMSEPVRGGGAGSLQTSGGHLGEILWMDEIHSAPL